MAYFKISLLTPRYKNSDIYFTQDVITQWDSPVKNHNQELSFNIHSLTYNEKFTKHQNGQKELTFSMNKHIVRQDEWFDNPFCNLITTGTQLLLEDQYYNHYIFTVTNVKFNFKENNIIYDISCQDSFSYQLTRQNNGYEITNDSSSEDFIGAKTLDWWVTQKIAKECYLYNYTYIPLFKGLYKTVSNTISPVYTSLPEKEDIAEIIKEIYSTEEDKDYYETIPFSCSGVSAAGALIALGDNLNMQLVVFEHINQDGLVLRYFWFEPKKNDKRVNLTYSPNKDIQSFGLSHKGESLTTILNVNGPTYDDELITLIPSIPSFWASYIESKEWKTSTYSPGFFKSLYKNTNITLNLTGQLPAWADGRYDIPINGNIIYHTYYDKFEFEENATVLTLSTGDYIYSKYHTFFLVRKVDEDETIYAEHEKLPSDPIAGEEWFVRVLYPSDEQGPGITSAYLSIIFYRDYTDAEEEFAIAADACPWLENKIINFNYFYDNNIISKQEYQDLNNLFNNKLRIINGQLLWYSQAHYNAIHYQTKLIADLTSKLDLLGATFEADFISPLADHGALATDISDFTNAYNNIFSSLHPGEGKSLINLDDLKEEYATKYFNAQQRFLKNLYNFRDYFEQRNNLYGSSIYKHKIEISVKDPDNYTINIAYPIDSYIKYNSNIYITIENISKEENVSWNAIESKVKQAYDKEYAFETIAWQRVNNNFDLLDNATKKPYVELYQQLNGQIKPQKIAYKYQPNLYQINTIKAQWSDEKSQYDFYNNNTIYATRTGTEGHYQYTTVTKDEVIKEYLRGHSQDNWYIYSQDPIYHNVNEISAILESLYGVMTNDALLGSLNSVGRDLTEVSADILKRYLPLNTVYKKVPRYDIKLKDNVYYWYRLNKKGETVLDYLKYKKRENTEESTIQNIIEVKNPWDEDQLVYMPFDFTTPDNEAYKYRLTRNYFKVSDWGWVGAFLSGSIALITTLAILSATLYNKAWTTSGDPAYTADGIEDLSPTKWLNKYIYYVTDTSWASKQESYIQSFTDSNKAIARDIGETSVTLDAIAEHNYFNGAWKSNNETNDTFVLDDEYRESYKYDLREKAFSYMLGSAENSGLQYRCNEYHLLKKGDFLYETGNYYACIISYGKTTTIYKNTLDDFVNWLKVRTLNDVAYYPLTTRFIRLDSVTKEDNGRALQDIIKDRYNSEDWYRDYIYTYNAGDSTTIQMIFFRQESYLRIPANDVSHLEDYYQKLYDTDTNNLVNYDRVPGLVKGFYELLVPETNIYVPVKWNDPEWDYNPDDPDSWDSKWLNTNFYTYDSTKKEYIQVYNIEQIKNNQSLIFNYIKSTTKEEELFTDQPSSYSFGIIEYNKTDNSIRTINKFFTADTWVDETTYKDEEGKIHTTAHCYYNNIDISLDIVATDEITARTNGEFWNAYHDAIDKPILMQQAIGIETQLTEYWSSAYLASKYCEYFIPENWHSTSISDIDYFKVITEDARGNVKLSTQYVPFIHILANEKHVFDLPRYLFKRSITSRGAIPNIEEEFKDKVIYHTSSELNNMVIEQAFANLGEDLNSWVFEEIGKTKYYYVDKNGGGTTWTNLTLQYNQQFSEFSGWYNMFYKILSTYTKQDESRYYDLLQEHDNFWAEIYKKYGYLLLENVYTNENATNSVDLLKMAQLYFKDLNTPERAYNITVIDTASLMNYNGAEIRLGDGIQIRANELYNEYDAIYQSLSQVLFVSDIGYSLRNVTDISLTVNDIKYSDKMIQRLAKLLR